MIKVGLPRVSAALTAVGVAALGLAGLAATAVPAAASPGNEARFVALINAERAQVGVGPLSVSGDLTGVARGWSAHMAAVAVLSHNPSWTSQITNWQLLGENVGVGSSVPLLDQAFYASQHHRENELNPAFTQVGVGTVESGGQIWVTVDFRKPTYATPPPPPRPVPAPPVSRGAAVKAPTALRPGNYLQSTDRSHVAVQQGDGNFVVYSGGRPVWASSRATGQPLPGAFLAVQGDGNLVLYGPYGAQWVTGTAGSGSGHQLVMQNDGNLVLYGSSGPLWATSTAGR